MSNNSIRESTPNPQLRLLALIGLFAVANLAVPSLINIDDELWVMSLAGLISEPVLLAIWFVFGTGDMPRRLARLMLTLALGWFTWLIGVRIAEGRLIPWEVGVFFAIAAMLLIGLLIGAGFAYRFSTGQVLCHRNELQRHRSRVFQFSIKQILGWTTGVALALMASRLLFVTNESDPNIWRQVPTLIGVGLSLAVLILIVTGTCLEFVLSEGSRIKWFAVFLLAVPLASVIATAVIIFGLDQPTNKTELFGNFVVFFACLSAITSLVLALVRWYGFRLVRTADISLGYARRAGGR